MTLARRGDRREGCGPWGFVRDPHFLLAVAAGPVGWLGLGATVFTFAPGGGGRDPLGLALVIIAYPVAEEWLFRSGIQPALAERLPGAGVVGISRANALTSLLFALAHLPFHPPLLAAATVIPSLLFGHCRERFGGVVPGMTLHILYNAGFFLLLAPRP